MQEEEIKRTEERWWELKYLKALNKHLPPRLVRDILKYPIEITQPIENLYIYGKIKTGKTVYAGHYFMHILKHCYLNKTLESFKFVTSTDLINEIKRTYSSDLIDEFEIVDKYQEFDYLIIDDIGAEKASEWVLQLFYTIINHRYEYLKTTIFTSNYDLDTLSNNYGDARITGRIDRMCKVREKKGY